MYLPDFDYHELKTESAEMLVIFLIVLVMLFLICRYDYNYKFSTVLNKNGEFNIKSLFLFVCFKIIQFPYSMVLFLNLNICNKIMSNKDNDIGFLDCHIHFYKFMKYFKL